MTAKRRIAAVALSVSVLAGGAVALAPTASAASGASCTYNIADHDATVDNGINYMTGPSTSYSSKGSPRHSDVSHLSEPVPCSEALS
jgi:hypothetical protein